MVKEDNMIPEILQLIMEQNMIVDPRHNVQPSNVTAAVYDVISWSGIKFDSEADEKRLVESLESKCTERLQKAGFMN